MCSKPSIPIWSHYDPICCMEYLSTSQTWRPWQGLEWARWPGRDATAHAEEDPHQDGSQHGDSGPQRRATSWWDLTRQFRRFGDDLVMIWWWFGDDLVMIWWWFDDDLMMILFGIKMDNPCSCFFFWWSKPNAKTKNRKIHGDNMWCHFNI